MLKTTKKPSITEVLRPEAGITKAYNLLKDRKSHKLSIVLTVLAKAGVKHGLSRLTCLGRVLRKSDNLYVYIDHRADTIQIFPMEKGVFYRNTVPVRGTSTTASKAKSKSKAAKSAARSKQKSMQAKAVRSVKAAVTSDDDVLENA